MPYKRRRRRYRRRRSRGSASYYLSLAAKAWRLAKYLRSVINVEKKCSVISGSATPSTSGVMTSLTSIAQGDDLADRSGNSVKLTSLQCRTRTSIHASASHTTLRFIIVVDEQQVEDTDPTVAKILETSDVSSGLNRALIGRFTVLMDRSFVLTANNNEEFVLNKFFKLKHHVRWNGAAATDKQKGHLYLLLISDEATNTPTVNYNFQLRYVDN